MLVNNEPTLSMVTESFRKKGYKAGFVMEAKDAIKCIETAKEYAATDLIVEKLHRFEGESDPADNAIVYAVKCNDGQKGVIIAAYGMYGSAQINNFMKKVKMTDRENIAGPVKTTIHH
ncbi:MAG: phosphoribosylpyrophosphate synthetase [Bacteroidetes bacterium]|nr:phosphoribosylpyrophosphate synthetase [Bacteroidota bacterium]